MKIVDIEKKTRRNLYKLYNSMDYPYVGFTANVDVTKLYWHCKNNNLSFFKTMMFLVSKACNSIKEFRYRICGENIIEYDTVHPSYTMMVEEDAFNFCTVQFTDSFPKFYATAVNEAEKLKGNLDLDHEEDRDDLIYITCIPWIAFTHVMHPIHMTPADSIPRVAWGKYYDQQDRKILPVNVQANHALIDGFHIGKFYELLEDYLENFLYNEAVSNTK